MDFSPNQFAGRNTVSETLSQTQLLEESREVAPERPLANVFIVIASRPAQFTFSSTKTSS